MDERIKDDLNLQSTAQEEEVQAILIAESMGEGTRRVLDRIIKEDEHEKLARCFLLSFSVGITLFSCFVTFYGQVNDSCYKTKMTAASLPEY